MIKVKIRYSKEADAIDIDFKKDLMEMALSSNPERQDNKIYSSMRD
jgi:hypothetical protein